MSTIRAIHVLTGAALVFNVALLICAEPPRSSDSGAAVQFEKMTLTQRYLCDGIGTGDIDRDGHIDVIAGPFWYSGLTFREAHAYYPPVTSPTEDGHTDGLFPFVHDFNSDGWPDILMLGRVHLHSAYWYENPKGADKNWAKHFVFERVRGESPAFVDLDGDGRPQVACHWGNCWGFIEPNAKAPTEPWSFHAISEPGDWKEFYHGTGVGDINGDSRLDVIINDGWYEQPKDASSLWIWHAQPFSPDRGGAQMLVYDVDGDGDNDVVSSLDAHGWGLAWFEQQRKGDEISFKMHRMMGTRDEIDQYGVAFTQPHALACGDINGDGLKDIVVGKRRWAHGPKGDIEPEADPVVYWFELARDAKGAGFKPHLIDDQSGVGVYITVADVNGDKKDDVLTASKLGSFVFLNKRP